MNDKQFEHIIKKKLTDYKPKVAADWTVFSEKMKVAKAASATTVFDQQVKVKLDNYLTSTPPQWDALKEKIAALDLEGQDNVFDSRVASELKNYQVTSSPKWAAFLEYKKSAAVNEQEAEFDEQVRASFDGFVTNTAPQWVAFKAFYSEFLAEENVGNFDDRIRNELDGHETLSEPQWDLFQAYKAGAELHDGDSLFDEEVKEQLDRYQSNRTPQWDKFLKKKKESDAVLAEANFDKSVLGQLKEVTRKYNSEHWLLLKARLENIVQVRRQIFSYKVLEMIFVSLMAFTFGNHLYLLTGYDTPSPIANNILLKSGSGTEIAIDKKSKENVSQKTVDIAQSTALENNVLPSDIMINNRAQQISSETSFPNAENIVSSSIGNNLTNSAHGRGSDGPSVSQANNNSLLAPILEESNNQVKDTWRGELSSLGVLAMLGLPTNLLMDHSNEIKDVGDPVYINPRAKKSYADEGNWWHIINAMDNGLITTPLNVELGLPEYKHEMYGYSVELLHSRQKGRLEVETGLGYSFLNYEPYDSGPKKYQTSKQLREYDFRKFKLDFINVPLRAKYHFIANGRWSVFGGVGINNEVILKTDYIVSDSVIFPIPEIPGQEPEESELPAFYSNGFTTGIFGAAPDVPTFVDYNKKSNLYILRGTLSLGAERNISDKFAVYLKAMYSHTLYNSNIGPYNDRLDKISFGMGFKMKL